MLIRGCFLAGLQLFIICQVDLVNGYYRHQRRLIEEIDWSYSGTLNQKNWMKKYPACNSAKQSPINIDEDLTQVNVNFKKLDFQGWEKESSVDTIIHNTGKTVEISLKNDYLLAGGALDSVYKASKITFHWGKCNAASDGSEHSLDGRKFPLEMQIYCYDAEQFKNVEEAVQENGKIKALAILFEIGPEDNAEYSAIIEGVDNVGRFGKQATLEPFILHNLLPNYTDKYFTYNGSLSSPPCTENVEWIVFKDTVKISEIQLEFFCEVLTMQQSGYVVLMDYLQNNFREQQYQFLGQVFSSYTGKEEIHETVCSSEAENVQADPKNYSSLLVTWDRPRVVYDAVIDKFAVFYQQLDGEDQIKHEFLTDGYQDLGAILNDMLPNTSYVLQVVSICTNGLYGKYSDQVIVDMPLDDPDIDLFSDLEEADEDIIEVYCCSFLDREEKRNKKDQRHGLTSDEILEEEHEDNDATGSIDIAENQIRKQEPMLTTSRPLREKVGTASSRDLTTAYANGVTVHAEDEVLEGGAHPTSVDKVENEDHENADHLDSDEQMIKSLDTEATPTSQDVRAGGHERLENASFPAEDISKDEAHAVLATEGQEITTTVPRESLPAGNWPDQTNDVPLDVTPTATPTQFAQDKFSHLEEPLSSQNPNTRMSDATQGYSREIAKELASPREEESRMDAGNVFDGIKNETARFTASSDGVQLNENYHTVTNIEGSVTATIYTGGSMLSQDTSGVDADLSQYLTSTVSPAELASPSIHASFGEHGAAASEVLSQTSQLVSNGEIPIQPSYTSEVLPLLTPLLSDTQTLQAVLATPALDLVLHATSVLPSVDVPVESTLSSSDGLRLPPFSSASFSCKLFRLFTVSEMVSQMTPSVMSDTTPLHESLVLADNDTLNQSGHAQLGDMVSHHPSPDALGTLRSAQEVTSNNQMSTFSQVERSRTDVKMHALSPRSELIYTSDVSLLPTFTASGGSSVRTHDSVGSLHEGMLFTKSHTEVMLKTSVVLEDYALFQPTHTVPSAGDMTDDYSGSGFFFTDVSDLKTGSGLSPDEITHVEPVVNDLDKLIPISGDEDELKYNPSLSEVSYHGENKVMVEMSSSASNNEIVKQETYLFDNPVPVFSTQGALQLQLANPTARISTPDITAPSDYLPSIPHMHAVSATSTDNALKPVQTSISNVAFSSAKIVLPSATAPLASKAPASSSLEHPRQMSFANSGVGMLHTNISSLPTDLMSNGTSRALNGSLNVDHGVNLTAPNGTAKREMLYFTSDHSISDILPERPIIPTQSVYAFTPLSVNEEYIPPDLFSSEHLDLVTPFLLSDERGPATNVDVKPPIYGTSALSWPTLPSLATVVSQDVSSFPSAKDLSFNTPSVSAFQVSAISVSVHDYVDSPKIHVSVAVVSSSIEGPSTLTMLSVFSKESSDVTPPPSVDARVWQSVVNEGLSVHDDTNSTSRTETYERKLVDDPHTRASVVKDETNLTLNALSEVREETKTLPGSISSSELSHGIGKSNKTTNPAMPSSMPPKSLSGPTVMDSHMQAVVIPTQNTSESKWAAFTTDEESGSGQGTSDSLNDNETSTDFSFSDLNERDRESEGAVGAGTPEFTAGSEKSSSPSVTGDHSAAFNVSEAEASNSSHESRVGLAEGLDSERKTVVPLVVVSALTFLCLLVLVGILVYWRKCFQTAHFYLEDNASPRVISTPPAAIFPASDDIGAIPVRRFPKHVADLHKRNGFTEEFEEVQSCTVDLGITSDNSNYPDNKSKNRYINIVAYDHSRVKLSQQPEQDGRVTDYINANYVDGYNKPKAYIAAQGPLKSTADDFWRMIWEHNVEVIVMITNLVEKGRRKCDQYWPDDSSEEYGAYLVTLRSSLTLAYYTVRKFTLTNLNMKKGSQKGRQNERTVVQYHYTQWPDMGVPDYTLPVLTFVRKASSAKNNGKGPTLVHCSAGVGRTGTYIVLDSMLKQIQREGTVNIFGFLKHIRTQRNYLVQTEEQYVFIHDALIEAILSKETEVLDTHIHSYVNALLTPGPTGKTRLEKQFKLLSQPNILQCDYSAALKQANREKNRTSGIIPVERARVGLPSLASEGTDYINASYIMGYHHSNEFIITQHPLLNTFKDFWRMIWDHNAQLVIMLADNQNMAEDEFVYWPNKEASIHCESFTVTMISKDSLYLSNEESVIIHDFILEATQDDYVLEVRHFQCPRWPNPDSPISKTFELLRVIAEEANSRDGPVIVHDELGGVTAGTFCALTTLMQQLETESSMDVYQVAKMINLMRPGVFTDAEQYQFLYQAMLSLVSIRQEEKPSSSADSNGVSLPDGNATESLESLV
ncbi:receptor-type tyrosine-protein phosphatase zeta isoform X2 [Ambystoma mexicanum]|uniref:receptor-type tyrosine-protein phosphatase zeta isoform X2 n=1 Tax=Ambystoma mexicanum TaxID=8296 RepID=UPI0037E79C6F